MSTRTDADRAILETAMVQWRNLQPQIAAEKARRGEIASKSLRPIPEALATIQRDVSRLWEESERLQRIAAAEPTCDTCKGARWVRNGNASPPRSMPCPTCWHSWYAEGIRRRWPLSPKEAKDSRKTFVKRTDAPEMEKVFRAVKAYGRNVIVGKADMFAITGPYGIGKTHLMLLLYRQIDSANRSVIYRTASQIRDILQGFKRFTEEERAIAKNDMLHVALLILDEAEKGLREPRDDDGKGEWFNSQMLDILNTRRNAGRATAIAGNDLFALPGAILSRTQEKGCVFLDIANVPDARPLLGGTDVTKGGTP